MRSGGGEVALQQALEAAAMAKDEARHGRGFEGLLKRYFNTEV